MDYRLPRKTVVFLLYKTINKGKFWLQNTMKKGSISYILKVCKLRRLRGIEKEDTNMSDISKVTVEAYVEGKARGYIIAPESEMKEVVIPSPPAVTLMPVNPRDAIIYLTEAVITPESPAINRLKEYAVDNKVVFICPESRVDEEIVESAVYAFSHAKALNIKKDTMSIKTDEQNENLGNVVAELLEDEDIEVDEVDIIEI